MDCQDDSTLNADVAWKQLVAYLSPPNVITPEIKSRCKELIEVLENFGYPVRRCIGSWFRVKFKHYFKANVLPEVMTVLDVYADYEAFEKITVLLGKGILKFLLSFYLVEETDSTFQKKDVYMDFTTILMEIEEVKKLFSMCCINFYKRGFDCYDNLAQDLDCLPTEHSDELKNFDIINRYLCCLYLFEEVVYDAVLHVLNSQIRLFINDNFAGCSHDTSIIGPVMSWLNSSVITFIQFITQHQLVPPNMEIWKKRLKFFCYKTIATVRINDLFEIMVDYPESHAAVLDIKKCIGHVQCSTYLVKTVQDMFKERLLHPGANTEDIITQYSSAIKVLRFLDPSGAILEKVCSPLRSYLKNRDDTIRCILNSLMSEEENELTRELSSTTGTLFNSNEDSDLENDDWEKWKPQSKDMPTDLKSKASKSADIISTLCSIYGSASVFVKEYRSLIAEKLLTTSNYDVSLEMRSMELLKVGFGEDMSQCQIMLQDVVDSKRTHANIINKVKQECPFEISTLIISHVFWPNLRKEEVNIYKPLQDYLSGEYQTAYSELKRSRTLEWNLNLGFVELDLEFEGRTLSFTVSPVQATIILCFEKSEKCHADTISNTIGLSLSQTRKKLAFWVTNGVLKETSKDMYELEKEVKETQQVVVEEMDSAMVKIEQVREEELEGFTNFVIGLINQSGQITVERVHKLLSLLLSDSPAGQLTPEEVKTFLDKKVKQKLLSFTGGVYKKPK
ncbi:hypothetical protein ACHWQZ_G009560 [Mnemiopsis leidyi]